MVTTVTFIPFLLFLFHHPYAPLFWLSSLNLNYARFPQFGVHRSLSLDLCRSVIVSMLLFCSLPLFFSLIHPLFLRVKDKRLHLIHPCVCPPVPENNTTPMFLVKPASCRGGQGSAAMLSSLQLAAPCWSQ